MGCDKLSQRAPIKFGGRHQKHCRLSKNFADERFATSVMAPLVSHTGARCHVTLVALRPDSSPAATTVDDRVVPGADRAGLCHATPTGSVSGLSDCVGAVRLFATRRIGASGAAVFQRWRQQPLRFTAAPALDHHGRVAAGRLCLGDGVGDDNGLHGSDVSSSAITRDAQWPWPWLSCPPLGHVAGVCHQCPADRRLRGATGGGAAKPRSRGRTPARKGATRRADFSAWHIRGRCGPRVGYAPVHHRRFDERAGTRVRRRPVAMR